MRIENFMLSLEIMWKGMLGIFVVMIILTFIVMLLTKIQSIKK
jgi:hypothetical protein